MSKKILIIEDEKNLASTLAVALGKRGYRVLTAFDGKSGYDKIIKDKPDLVLLDILMPKMFGIDLLEKVRADKNKIISKTSFFILTNYPEKKYKAKAKKLQVEHFLVKSESDISDIIDYINVFFKK